MEERNLILRVEDWRNNVDKNVLVKTQFSIGDLDVAIDQIRDNYDDPQDSDKLIKDLESKGYIRVCGPAPEILDLY